MQQRSQQFPEIKPGSVTTKSYRTDQDPQIKKPAERVINVAIRRRSGWITAFASHNRSDVEVDLMTKLAVQGGEMDPILMSPIHGAGGSDNLSLGLHIDRTWDTELAENG